MGTTTPSLSPAMQLPPGEPESCQLTVEVCPWEPSRTLFFVGFLFSLNFKPNRNLFRQLRK